jgi:hypothetical protein
MQGNGAPAKLRVFSGHAAKAQSGQIEAKDFSIILLQRSAAIGWNRMETER